MLKINDFNRKSFSVISNGKVASTKPIIKMMKCMQDAIEDGGCIVDIISLREELNEYGSVVDTHITIGIYQELEEIKQSVFSKIKDIIGKTSVQVSLTSTQINEHYYFYRKAITINPKELSRYDIQNKSPIAISFAVDDLDKLVFINTELKIDYDIPNNRDDSYIVKCNKSLKMHLKSYGVDIEEDDDKEVDDSSSIRKIEETNFEDFKVTISSNALENNKTISKILKIIDILKDKYDIETEELSFSDTINEKCIVTKRNYRIKVLKNPYDLKISTINRFESILTEGNEKIELKLIYEDDKLGNIVLLLNKKYNEESELYIMDKGVVDIKLKIDKIYNIYGNGNFDLNISYLLTEKAVNDKEFLKTLNNSLSLYLKDFIIALNMENKDRIISDKFINDVNETIFSKEAIVYKKLLTENSILDRSDYSIVYDGEFSIVSKLIGNNFVKDLNKARETDNLPITFRYELIDLQENGINEKYSLNTFKVNQGNDSHKYHKYILDEILKDLNPINIKSYEIKLNRGFVIKYRYDEKNNILYLLNKNGKLVASIVGVDELSVKTFTKSTTMLINNLLKKLIENNQLL